MTKYKIEKSEDGTYTIYELRMSFTMMGKRPYWSNSGRPSYETLKEARAALKELKEVA